MEACENGKCDKLSYDLNLHSVYYGLVQILFSFIFTFFPLYQVQH